MHFQCLEDRFMTILYQKGGEQPLQELASDISITANAALSIVHRVSSSYPQYLTYRTGEEGRTIVFVNESQVDSVQHFLAGGGFTRINEQEFILYYKKELRQEKWRSLSRRLTQESTWKKALMGTALLVGSGWALSYYFLRRQNER